MTTSIVLISNVTMKNFMMRIVKQSEIIKAVVLIIYHAEVIGVILHSYAIHL